MAEKEYEPSPDEIELECQIIRASWSDDERVRRTGATVGHYREVDPSVRLHALERLEHALAVRRGEATAG